MTHVLLVDGKNALYRAAMGSGWLQPDYDGDQGAHVYLFVKAVLRAVRYCAPCTPVIVWEGERNWRRKLYPEYKAHRALRDDSPTPKLNAEADAMMVRFREDQLLLRSFLSALGAIQVFPDDGEADDAMATLARHRYARGDSVSIWTGDLDMLQCVRAPDDGLVEGPWNYGVRVITPGKAVLGGQPDDVVYATVASVMEKLGVPPAKVPDLKAIEGDASDNLPGVPGLGRVAATKLLAHNGTLEGVILCANMAGKHGSVAWNASEKQRLAVVEHAEAARLYRRLASLDQDVAIRYDRPRPDVEQARRLVAQLRAPALARQGTFAEMRATFGAGR